MTCDDARRTNRTSNGLPGDVNGYIRQSVLPKRYGICKSSLSDRISKLGLKTLRRGGKCYLLPEQLEVLDELDEFLKNDSSASIEDFLIIHHYQPDRTSEERYIRADELPNQLTEHLPDTLKTQLDEALLSINQLEAENNMWKTHALNEAQKIEALERQNTGLQLVNFSLSTYATNQNIEKQRAEFEREQLKANLLVWQQYAEEMKRELTNIATRERSKGQTGNVVQCSNRQYQNTVLPYPSKLVSDTQ